MTKVCPAQLPSQRSLIDEAAASLLVARKVGMEARVGADGGNDVAAGMQIDRQQQCELEWGSAEGCVSDAAGCRLH